MKEYIRLESEDEDKDHLLRLTKDTSTNSLLASSQSRLKLYSNININTQANAKANANEYYYIHINHPELNSQYETNLISTAKYTWYNLIPKILIEQFAKMANVYFLIIAILQSIKDISYSGGIPVILLPLTFVICLNGIKDIFEDFKRKRSDEEENNRECDVYDSVKGDFIKTKWKDIRPGAIVKVYQDEAFPADVLLINSAEEHGVCYIETSNLDGETSLKYRKAHSQLREGYRNVKQFDIVHKVIRTSKPNELIYEFEGKVYDYSGIDDNGDSDETEFDTIDRQSFLLRGCYLKQTEYIIGVVIYLGHNTKSMKNAPNPRSKTSKVEDIMNMQIIVIFLFQVSLSIIAALCNMYMHNKDDNAMYLELYVYIGSLKPYSFIDLLTQTGTWLLIFTNLVPISLLVTMEMIKFIQGMFIQWDIELYDKERGIGAKVQTSTLNEELGQVKFVFTDKTGTLTRNHMTFRKMMIGKELYGVSEHIGHIEDNGNDNDANEAVGLNDQYGRITNTNFIDFNNKLYKHINKEEVFRFFECIVLCHSLIPDIKLYQTKAQLVYQASSPDEMSLVSFARQFGFIFKHRSIDNVVTIEINGTITQYEILSDLEYTSERKRMSVIVKCPDGKIRIYTKGADTVISKLLTQSSTNKDLLKHNEAALTSFANEGLRTLMMAYREIDLISFQHFNQAYRAIVSDSDIDKEFQLPLLYNSIECQLNLLGVTAIEDQLQDKVDETLEYMSNCGIRVWMLTGDKMDTAKSVAYSCKLINEGYEIIEIPEKASMKTISGIISKAKERIKAQIQDNGQYALLISSSELDLILNKDNKDKGLCLRNDFYSIALHCQSVICSRVTPHQKAELVSVIKEYQQGTVLAIGDGANDVKMITKADIGIGVIGIEGSQAARASDYSITTFHHLKRLLFIHGRDAYRKNTYVICYNFYKNALFVMPQFWMGIISQFSGQTLYDRWIYQFFNPLFACVPIIWYGVYDKELNDTELLNEPMHYKKGIKNKLFHSIRLWKWIGAGVMQGLLIYIFSFYSLGVMPGYNGKTQDMWSIGTMAYALIVLIANLEVMRYTNSHTWASTILILGSIGSYFIIVGGMSQLYYFYNYNNWVMVFGDLRFHLGCICLCVFVLCSDSAIARIMIYYGCVKEEEGLCKHNRKGQREKDNEIGLLIEEEDKDIVNLNNSPNLSNTSASSIRDTLNQDSNILI